MRIAEGAVGIGRKAEAALVDRDAIEPSHEVRQLLPPRKMISAEPMQENDRGAASRALVVELEFADADAAGNQAWCGGVIHRICLEAESTTVAGTPSKT